MQEREEARGIVAQACHAGHSVREKPIFSWQQSTAEALVPCVYLMPDKHPPPSSRRWRVCLRVLAQWTRRRTSPEARPHILGHRTRLHQQPTSHAAEVPAVPSLLFTTRREPTRPKWNRRTGDRKFRRIRCRRAHSHTLLVAWELAANSRPSPARRRALARCLQSGLQLERSAHPRAETVPMTVSTCQLFAQEAGDVKLSGDSLSRLQF